MSKLPNILLVVRCCIRRRDGKILLIKRRSDDRFNPSLWEFPGGKVDEGEDLSDAQPREIKEEVNLSVEMEKPLVCIQSKVVGSDGKPYDGDTYVEICGLAQQTSGTANLDEDHVDFTWVEPEKATFYDLSPETEKSFRTLEKHLL